MRPRVAIQGLCAEGVGGFLSRQFPSTIVCLPAPLFVITCMLEASREAILLLMTGEEMRAR
jgi:hypothetical protein